MAKGLNLLHKITSWNWQLSLSTVCNHILKPNLKPKSLKRDLNPKPPKDAQGLPAPKTSYKKQAHTFEIRTKVEPSKEGVKKNLFLCFVLLLLWLPQCSY
jgi:hypothetical protein